MLNELRIPPQNLDAERGVLGSLMLMPSAIDEISDILRADDFYQEAHTKIFVAMKDMHERGVKGIDPVTLYDELSRRQQIEEIGGAAYIAEIVETVPHAAHVRYYAKIVADKSKMRRVIYLCTDTLQRAYNEHETEDVLSFLDDGLIRMRDTGAVEVKTFADTVSVLIDEMNGQSLSGLSTGFRDLDNAIGGWRPGNLIILAGETGGGKSALALAFAVHAANAGNRVCIVSAEMLTAEVHERVASSASSIDALRVRRQQLSDTERERWVAAVERAAKLPIQLIDNNRNLQTLIHSLRSIHRRERLALVIVDYAQLIQSDGANREREVANVSASFKGLAADLQIPVIALAQLNDEAKRRENKQPQLGDLRESRALAHDANLVLMLHAPDPESEENDLHIRKGRSVAKGKVTLVFRKQFTRFQESVPVSDADYSFGSDGRNS